MFCLALATCCVWTRTNEFAGPSFTTDEFTAWMNVLGFQDFVKDACTIEFQDLFKFTEDELAACFLVDDHSAPAKCLQVLRLHRCMHPTVYARHSSELAKKLHEAGFQQFLPKLHGLVLADLGCMQRHELIAALASSPRERAAVTQMHRLLQKWGNSGSHVPPVAGATARSGAGGDAGAGASASGSGGAEASSQPAWVPRSGVAVPTAEVPEQHIRMGAFTIVKQAYPDPNSQPELDKDPDVHRVLIANYGGRKVALKVFPPSAREQARREAAVLVELHRRHFPGAVQLQGDFVDEKYGSCFLVLEYGRCHSYGGGDGLAVAVLDLHSPFPIRQVHVARLCSCGSTGNCFLEGPPHDTYARAGRHTGKTAWAWLCSQRPEARQYHDVRYHNEHPKVD